MPRSNNDEPRRIWNRREVVPHRARRCVSCGARASAHSADLAFCDACLDWARQDSIVEWDDLGGGD